MQRALLVHGGGGGRGLDWSDPAGRLTVGHSTLT